MIWQLIRRIDVALRHASVVQSRSMRWVGLKAVRSIVGWKGANVQVLQ
jgi:hypothetical protein